MTATHRFVDTEGGTVAGREACVAAWRGFFESFPDYRNVFTAVEDQGGGQVVARGQSVCTVPELDGPAVWLATVVEGRVDRWQVAEVADGTGGGTARDGAERPVRVGVERRRLLRLAA